MPKINITKSQFRQLIKEELSKVLQEQVPAFSLTDDMGGVEIPSQTLPSGESVGGRSISTDDWMTEDEPSSEELMTPQRTFDQSFDVAREGGEKEFFHRDPRSGKEGMYHTRKAGESREEWHDALGRGLPTEWAPDWTSEQPIEQPQEPSVSEEWINDKLDGISRGMPFDALDWEDQEKLRNAIPEETLDQAVQDGIRARFLKYR